MTRTLSPTKRCGSCGRTLPRSEFYPRSKGSHLLQSYCKGCHVKKQVEYGRENWKEKNRRAREGYRRRMQNPEYAEKMKAQWAAYHESRKHDPEYMAARAFAGRIWREKNGAKIRAAEEVEGNRRVFLPVKPFADWIDQKLDQGVTLLEMAKQSGIDDRALRRIKNIEYPTVEIATVDQVLTAFDDHVIFLYPEAYD